MDSESLTTGQAAKLLGVSPRTVRLWCSKGKLAYWASPGGHRQVSKHAVEEMLAERRSALE